MRLLITRPATDARALITRLQSHGIEIIPAPLMEITPREIRPDMRQQIIQAQQEDSGYLLFTSANGVRALFGQMPDTVDMPCFCVGGQTAQAASAAGWVRVHQAKGDVETLVQLISASDLPKGAKLFHLRAKDHRGDLVGKLLQKQYSVQAVCAYNAQRVEHLPPYAVRAITEGRLDGVVLYSPRTAKLLEAMMQNAGLMVFCQKLRVYALSQAVGAELIGQWGAIWYPERPDSAALEVKIIADG